MIGSIPPELGKLANLTLLDFNANDLSGPIPPELGELAKLTYLHLYGNDLSGPIPPELGHLGHLTRLWLGDNQLTGPIPSELGNLNGLETLYLNDNVLIGPIPPELAKLGNLTRLWLGGNQLTGQIPSELGNLANLESLDLDHNALTGPIPPQFGSLSNLERLDLDYNALTGPIPSELGSLSNLKSLDLDHNALTGPIPPQFGNLSNLERLDVDNNALTGPIPQSILQLDRLRYLYIRGNDGLCVPGTSAFVAWLRTFARRDDESESLCNAVDLAVLTSLFEAAGGSGWGNSGGWLDDFALDEWYGVTADSLGRVTELDLTRNGLAGRMPTTLGELARLMELRIGGNGDLAGRLPLSLRLLPLRAFHYSGTGLCAPVDAPFQAWLAGIGSHEGTGADCAPLSDREALEALYEATGGPAWAHSENWLMDAPVGDWYGVQVDEQGRAVELYLDANGLRGRIPPELGGLAHLQTLFLYRNGLTGPIPHELGNLADLAELSLGENGLTGPIPSELGNLANLRMLDLRENELTGPIPSELGDLAELGRLTLAGNNLTGSIPPELGNLARLGRLNLGGNDLTGSVPVELGDLGGLRWLNLATNRLTGAIPPELGGLVNLGALYLGANELTGPVPPEVGGLTDLRHLALQLNAGLSGALPLRLVDLTALESLQAGGTDLCSPADAAFGEWLEGVPNRRVTACARASSQAYLVQAVQSPESAVPLIAGEEALLRVFPTAKRANNERVPRVLASFYVGADLVHVADIPRGPGLLPTELDEGSLATSSHALVPGEVVRPGLELVVEIDPDRTLDAALGVPTRIPETGRLAVSVRDMPVLDLTLVPFLWTEDPDSVVLESVGGMASDPEGNALLGPTRTLLPVGEVTVAAHDPVLSSSNNAYDLLNQTAAIRVMEGGTGYWMGMLSGGVTGAGGLSGGEVSFAVDRAEVIAHEFGHNFGLPHAPCGGAANPDPAYPTPDGTIGAWGYDFHARRLLPPTSEDLMGYCAREGIADYFFTKALHHRLATERVTAAAVAARPERSLLLWGGRTREGAPYLDPAFVVDAVPSIPDAGGEYIIEGMTGEGTLLFSFPFDMPLNPDAEGREATFVFTIPAQAGWAGNLARITLSGPGGSATLDETTDQAMAILRDSRTGQVRAFLWDLPPATQAAADAVGDAAGQGLEALFSRGIPSAEAWRR